MRKLFFWFMAMSLIIYACGESPTTPEGLSAQALSAGTVALSWQQASDNREVIGYRVYRDGVEIHSLEGTSYTDVNLNPLTTYCYSVASVDSPGNFSAESQEACATTLEDTLLPSIPQNLFVETVSSIRLDLFWDESTDDSRIDFYQIYRDGEFLTNAVTNTIEDFPLDKLTTYCYQVEAQDASGKLSGPGDEVCGTTEQ